MRSISDTIEFIKLAHKGQKYGDEPYWKHPLEVALEAERFCGMNYVAICSALLHDVVEDTDYDLDYILEHWGDEVAEAVGLLTKDPNLSYAENIESIIESGNMIAMQVKIADNIVNMRGDKSHMSEARRTKLEDRYAKSLNRLLEAI